MTSFLDYFSAKTIIKTLCKYRIAYAKKAHKYHLLRDVSLHPKSILLLHGKQNCPPDLKELFPSRRSWVRPNLEKRKKINNTQQVRIASLYATVITTHLKVLSGELNSPIWYDKLQKFIIHIQNRVANPSIQYLSAPTIKPIKKENLATCKICRPISLYNLEDRIIIGATAKYFTDLFDPLLQNCSYAFRSTKIGGLRTHHDTIKAIESYRHDRKGKDIFVAEADLEKFFDIINHRIIYQSLEKFKSMTEKSGNEVDLNAEQIFLQYLSSYAFNKDVYTKNDTNYFIPFKIVDGRFEWPLEKLKKIYEDINNESIGIPQGGALSCLIANMILHDVDEQVDCEPKDPELLYLRFCDDMVILHTSEQHCTYALNRYSQKLRELNLLMHQPEAITEYDSFFWKTKSKRPYNWAAKIKRQGNVPWLGFVGYQIRYDGIIRVRQKSLKKEADKQRSEMRDVLRALNLTPKTKLHINKNSRKSKKQQLFALENRLISMSVGRVKLYNYTKAKQGLCWTNGFQCLNMNFVSKSQCKYLDSCRRKNLKRFSKALSALNRESHKPEPDLQKTYFGHPFSYHGFLRP